MSNWEALEAVGMVDWRGVWSGVGENNICQHGLLGGVEKACVALFCEAFREADKLR